MVEVPKSSTGAVRIIESLGLQAQDQQPDQTRTTHRPHQAFRSDTRQSGHAQPRERADGGRKSLRPPFRAYEGPLRSVRFVAGYHQGRMD
ncbi:hypothetical protein [Pseudomonas veronii]